MLPVPTAVRMPTLLYRLVAALLLMLAGMASTRAQIDPADRSRVPDGPLHEQVLDIPGDSASPVTLQVTLYTPVGNGPFPLAVMNHGAPMRTPAIAARVIASPCRPTTFCRVAMRSRCR